jgi:outer membrane protein OmpA-like peptidoglycan-associated protein
MRSTILFNALGAALFSAGLATAHAAQDTFYNPSNAASPTGYTIGHELFRTIGCPGRELLGTPCEVLDSDGDGVFDYMDKCPDTPSGVKVDKDGCPLPVAAQPAPAPAPAPAAAAAVAPAVAAAVAAAAEPAPPPVMPELRGANFDFDRAVIRREDTESLDQSVATLKEWGDVKVEVAGHTDNWGPDDYNQGLSLRRANAVRNYLTSKGIAADRLIVRGYGESRPVADNATAAGRFMNRRVELVPQK